MTDQTVSSFYDRPNVETVILPIASGIKLGIERVTNTLLGMGGAYGAWGESFDNQSLPEYVEGRLGRPLEATERLNLAELGFQHRHHVVGLTPEQNLEVELEAGAQLIRNAARANGWAPADVQGLLIGMTSPIADDYVERIARKAGVRDDAMMVSVHKACDGSIGALNLALNPRLATDGKWNVAEELAGKRVLVGGIEGLSRFVGQGRDKNALQLFGNGMGLFGLIPGETMKFLTGKSHETYDNEGLLQVRMTYPHSHELAPGKSLLEVFQNGVNHIRVAGMMHEPADGMPIAMAGLMGMVKLFVRTGVEVVADVNRQYQTLMSHIDESGRSLSVAIAHQANYKINLLKAKQLIKEGVQIPTPWLLSDFGNVSAASCAIAFLRQLQEINPGDHVLFDGFGAGTYYDVLAAAMG